MNDALILKIMSSDYKLYRELLSVIEGGNSNVLIICYDTDIIEITLSKINIDLKYIISLLNEYNYTFISLVASEPLYLITIKDIENFIEYIETLIKLKYVHGLSSLDDYRYIEKDKRLLK